MRALLKKEFTLCLHPTCLLFLCFSAFVFIPNYPYEVMFFFSGLSVFFVCLTARENGDAAFTCCLPVKKEDAAAARIFMCVLLQLALIVLAAVMTAVKELCFSVENQINMAGIMANVAFIGGGAFLLGTFNLLFFPAYYANPQKVGKPFILAGVAVFAVIFAFIALRFTVPFVRDTLNTPDPADMGAKLAVLCAGCAAYILFTLFALRLSKKRFKRFNV